MMEIGKLYHVLLDVPKLWYTVGIYTGSTGAGLTFMDIQGKTALLKPRDVPNATMTPLDNFSQMHHDWRYQEV